MNNEIQKLLIKYKSMINFKDKQQSSNYKFVYNFIKFNAEWNEKNTTEKLENQLQKVDKIELTNVNKEDLKNFIYWKMDQQTVDRNKEIIDFIKGAIRIQEQYLKELEQYIIKFKI